MTDFTGDSGNNIFTGGSDPDTATGEEGDDALSGNGSSDVLIGGAGLDTLQGGDGEDRVYSHTGVLHSFYGLESLDVLAEADVLAGGAGDDRIFAGYGDTIDGGTHDVYGDRLSISFLGSPTGVSADFRLLQTQTTLTIGSTSINNVEDISYLEGSDHDDFLVPFETNYVDGASVYGRGGNDHIIADYYTGYGGGGLHGGDGNDILDGRPDQYGTEIYGDAGNDTIYSSHNIGEAYGGDDNDTIYASSGFAFGGSGDDLIVLSGEGIFGGSYGEDGDDEIHASDRIGGHMISGGAGADELIGGLGTDTLVSADFLPEGYYVPAGDVGLEQDVLTGGDGNDTLVIGYGDSADGGAGDDTLNLSLGGLASGTTFSTAAIVGGIPFVLGGGTIQNIETFAYLRGTDFGDTLVAATQASLLTIDAAGGNDVIQSNSSSVAANGGDGDDRFVSGLAGDVFNGGAGTDTLDYSAYGSGVTVAFALDAGATGTGAGGDQLIFVENIDGSAFADTLGGSNEANFLLGNDGADALSGQGGNDVLVGGVGDDTLNGGLGDDTFYVDADGDAVVEADGQGNDRVSASVSYFLALAAAVETLETANQALTSALNLGGSDFANTLYGNAGQNFLYGLGGGDTLWGFAGDDYLVGGSGADVMYGGLGNDTYYIDVLGDLIYELAGEGSDRVAPSISYTLPDNAEVELVEAITLSATDALNLGGSSFANTIYGNNGANFLYGYGGADWLWGFGGHDYLVGGSEADVMYGGLGNDTYYVDATGDLIYELAGEGTDRVAAEITLDLPDSADIELLEAVNQTATTAMDLGGSDSGNTVVGNNGVNILHGHGGDDALYGLEGDDYLAGDAGNDTMTGGAGNDTYYVDAQGDAIAELSGEGSDRLVASASYALAAGADIELVETADEAGTGALALTGSDSANTIRGNAGANTLDGKAGGDVLWGLGGADTFAFTAALGAGNVDSIADFQPGSDRLALDDAVFTALAAGALPAGALRTGAAAADADDRIVYDSATGALLYDADGNGAGAAVHFAALTAGLNLAAADFVVI